MGFAWQPLLLGVLLVGLMVAAGVPELRRQFREEQRRQTIRTLTRIAMAKEYYAVEHDLLDGQRVELKQLVGTPYVEQRPTFPMEGGELILHPIGELPVYQLPDGETLRPAARPGRRR